MNFFRRSRRIAAISTLPCCKEIGAHLRSSAERRGGKATILVTSPSPLDGKTTVASNVAKLLAESGARCAMATADQAAIRALSGSGRAARAIDRIISGEAAMHAEEGSVDVLQIDDFCASPLFGAEGPGAWTADGHILIIDGPIVRHVLTQTLVPSVDGVLLVVDTRRSSLRSVLTAKERIDKLGGKFLGAVLNRHRSPIPRLFDEWADHA